ncbi:unnamed protein product [Alternaria alternata]
MTYKEIYPWTDPSRFNLFEDIEDPVDRWHKLVNMYSGLGLTYASDRLPAVAAIVEREMRLRLDDVYIAVTNASITMEGHTYTIRVKETIGRRIFQLESCFEIVSHSLLDVVLRKWSAHMDFDWSTGDRPVRVGDTFVVLPISLLSEEICYTGLILREVTDGVFERMGIIDIGVVWKEGMTDLEETQLTYDFVEALPIRQVKII